MTIPKAIEILKVEARESRDRGLTDDADAMELGIEALIRVRDDRGTSYQPTWYPLPSETEE